MSRSNPTPTNPANKFFKWSGSKGQLVYYDKESKLEVEVKQPFSFLVLDQLATITGYSDADESGYWSNEVRSIAKDELTVRTSKGVRYAGLYKNEIGVRQVPQDSKYAKSVYIAYKDGKEYVIGNLKASGAALTAWIEFGRLHNVNKGKVTLTGAEEAKKGTTVYFTPTFEWSEADTDEEQIAIDLDKELQIYLSQYLAAAKFDRASEEAEEPVAEDLDALNEVFPERLDDEA